MPELTLTEAIEIIKKRKKYFQRYYSSDFVNAYELLIEAGERCQRLRSDKHCSPTKLLPGEKPE